MLRTLKFSFEKFMPTTVSKLLVQNDTSIAIECVTKSLCKSFVGGPSYGRNQFTVQ